MLLNFSNHPSSNWDTKQKEIAIDKYGRILDLEFPIIDPELNETEIKGLVLLYFKKCTVHFNNADINNAVHIMGEHTFIFQLINMLIRHGYKCIASTTKRNSINIDENKLSRFEFVKFREYQL